MRNIQEIDRELERARQKMERSRKLDVILQDLKEQSVRRRQAEEEARAVLEKEQGDVEELERMSLVSFLARIQGDLESRKAEERREAAMAKARYDAMQYHAGSCVQCGACEKRCPYNLPIRDMLTKVADLFGY